VFINSVANTDLGAAQKHEFQAETRKILDIVVRSLYTEREVLVYAQLLSD
jgi:TNF receptor-associated protein 1